MTTQTEPMQAPPSLPDIALSVRQPWAWAIVAGHKDVENRSSPAVTKGNMRPRAIALHAAKGMTKYEYDWAASFMLDLGIVCPRPDLLVRGAVIGGVTVTAVVKESESPWFFGPRGLLLRDAFQVEPIPAAGALGFFRWAAGGALPDPLPWMLSWPGRPRATRAAAPTLL